MAHPRYAFDRGDVHLADGSLQIRNGIDLTICPNEVMSPEEEDAIYVVVVNDFGLHAEFGERICGGRRLRHNEAIVTLMDSPPPTAT